MALAPPIPQNAPVTGPEGIVTPPWFAFFRQVLSGVTGPIGPQGSIGPTGPQGPVGTRGSEWFSGSGAPGVISGSQNNDFYLDLSTSNVYELSAGVWVLQGNISPTGNVDGGQSNTNFGGGTSISGGTA